MDKDKINSRGILLTMRSKRGPQVICDHCSADVTDEVQIYLRDKYGELLEIICRECSWRRLNNFD